MSFSPPHAVRRPLTLLLATALTVGLAVVAPAAVRPAAAVDDRVCVHNVSLITSPVELDAVHCNPTGDYQLANDIDMSAYIDQSGGTWDGLTFNGSFDGHGHTISGLHDAFRGGGPTALFYYLGPGATVRDVGVANGPIGQRHAQAGLAIDNYGTITGCHVTGNVAVEAGGVMDAFGGLVAFNAREARIADSYTTGNVAGHVSGAAMITVSVGGLVGKNVGTITNSYATGDVTSSRAAGDVMSDTRAGGLVGVDMGSIINSYATGAVTSDGTAGGLVGDDMGHIIDSHATGNVTSLGTAGGLVGYHMPCADTPITGSYATGDVTGTGEVGGLVGRGGDSITDSYATGTVTGTGMVGGLVGYGYSGLITGSHASGAVISEDSSADVGGLVGYQNYLNPTMDRIVNSYATGPVAGGAHTGGLVGYNTGTITNSYASGPVTGGAHTGGLVADSPVEPCPWCGGAHTGGLVGYNTRTITNSYATGRVTGDGDRGGLVGATWTPSSITGSFFDIDTTGQANGIGQDSSANASAVTGLHASSLTQSTFTAAGWDFDSVWTMPGCHAWPVLQWQDQAANPGGCTPLGDLSGVIAQLVALLQDLLSRLLAMWPMLFPH